MAESNLPDQKTYDTTQDYQNLVGGLGALTNKLQGTDPEDLKGIQEEIKKRTEELQHRYDQPNWWKVAAGFAKPQLGGFLASAGSAAQAMGENTELQRAQMMPLAQLAISGKVVDTLAGRAGKQKDAYNKALEDGSIKDPKTLQQIISMGYDSDIGKTASKLLDDVTKSLQNINQTVNNATTAQEGANKYPQLFENLSRIAQDSASLNSTDEEKQKRIKDRNDLLNNNIPPQTDKQVWQTLSADEKIKRIQDYNKAKQEEGLTDLQKTKNLAVSDSQDLPILRSIRNLSLGVGIPNRQILKDGKNVVQTGQQQMAELLGKFSTADILDLIGKGADEGRLGDKLKGIRDLFIQGNFSPEAQPAFENLIKQLARLQVDTRNGSVNPTDTFSNLLGKGSANTSMSQNGFVRVIDTMAHDKKRNLETYEYLASHPEIKTTDLHFDPKFKKTLDQMDEERSNISTHSPNASLPWYYNRSGNREEQKNTNTKTSDNPPKSGHGPAYKQFRKDPKDPKSPIVWYEDKDGNGWPA